MENLPGRANGEGEILRVGGSLSLREKLSEKELELLEMRSTAMQEASYLRSALRKREIDILEGEANVRQLKLQLQEEQGQLQLEKAKHETKIRTLTSQVQSAVKEVNRFREKVQKAEARRAQTKQAHAREMAKKEQALLELERKNQLLQSRVEAQASKEDAMEVAEVAQRREVRKLEARCLELQAACEKYQKQLDKLKSMYAEKERTLATIRRERDKAESRVTELQATIDQMPAHRESNKQDPPDEKIALYREQILTMRKELQSCVKQLKEWRSRVHAAESKVQQLEGCRGSNQKSLEPSNDAGLEDLQKARAQAEWKLVSSAQEQQNLAKALEREKDSTKTMSLEVKQLKEENLALTAKLESTEHELRSKSGTVAKLTTALEEADQLNMQKQEDSRERALAESRETEVRYSKLAKEAGSLRSAAKTLVALIESQLEGEQPDIDLLLDQVSPKHADTDFSKPNAFEKLVNNIIGTREHVCQTRERLADVYAEKIGNECQMQ